MNGQYLMNRPLSLSYAFKKDTRGERHGTPAERLLAAQVRAGGEQLLQLGASGAPEVLGAEGVPQELKAVVEAQLSL